VINDTIGISDNKPVQSFSTARPTAWKRSLCYGKTNVRHIGILLPVSISTISPQSACYSASSCQIPSKSDHPRWRYDVISVCPPVCHTCDVFL